MASRLALYLAPFLMFLGFLLWVVSQLPTPRPFVIQ